MKKLQYILISSTIALLGIVLIGIILNKNILNNVGAIPNINILGNYAVVGTGLNATTTANAHLTASGTIAFVSLGSSGNPCLTIGTDGTIATSTCGSDLTFPLIYASTTHITATTPLTITSGVLSMPTSTASQNGFLLATDWTTFNAKITTSSLSSTATGLTYTSNTGVFSLTNGYEIPTTASTSAWNAGGAPGGSNNQIQFNNGGTFGADSGFTFSSSSQRVALANSTSSLTIGTGITTTSTIASSTSFSYTGATSSFIIPADVSSITITAEGAGGGTTGAGAIGGVATGTLAVNSGETYYFNIGQAATSTVAPYGGGGVGSAGGGSNGWAGGGMTWFSATSSFSTSNVILVAGGGGGSGTNGTADNGGGGGGTTGIAGTNSGNAIGGGGGTQSAGGAGGANGGAGGSGSAGSAGQGGAGSTGANYRGGGGGGGYFGGGGGGSNNGGTGQGGGGGGGSSFLSSSLTATSTASSGGSTDDGTLLITYNLPVSDQFSLAVGGHILTGGTAPVISSCGTSPSITGNDVAGTISIGSGGITSCIMTYNQAYLINPPSCIVTVASSSAAYAYISTNTIAFTTIGLSSSMQSGTKLNYFCIN